jgi:hypothetical protein
VPRGRVCGLSGHDRGQPDGGCRAWAVPTATLSALRTGVSRAERELNPCGVRRIKPTRSPRAPTRGSQREIWSTRYIAACGHSMARSRRSAARSGGRVVKQHTPRNLCTRMIVTVPAAVRRRAGSARRGHESRLTVPATPPAPCARGSSPPHCPRRQSLASSRGDPPGR